MTNFSRIISVQLNDNSTIKQEEQLPKKHKISCKNCARLHHKCDKMLPSCSHCLKKGVKCEVNPSVKKRGRPFGTTKDILEKKKLNKRNVNTTSNNTQDFPETKRVKILSPPREMPCTSIPIDNLVFFQVPIDINWDFSFQNHGVNKNNTSCQSQNEYAYVSNQDVYGSQNVNCIIQPNMSTIFQTSCFQTTPNTQTTSQITTTSSPICQSTDFSVSSPPSEESISCDDFVLDVENFDFDNFNTFLVDQEFQFC